MSEQERDNRRRIHQRRARRIALILAIGIPLFVIGLGTLKQGRPVEVVPPPADAEPGRWYTITGAQNTRDAGGYVTRNGRMVKRGVVYRSGTLSHVQDAGCEDYRKLNITSVVDYRNRVAPWPLFNGDVMCIHLVSRVYGFQVSFRSEGPEDQRYVQGLMENADAYIDTFDLLADPEKLPLMYHCHAGTDRTGVMSALLLSLLGVERETILEDFRLSEKVGTPGNLPGMLVLLDEIDRAGGIEKYLTNLGVSPKVQERVRENLLE